MTRNQEVAPYASDLLIILGMVLAVNLPYFSPRSVPVHDTMQNFDIFYFFYNNFFWHGALPLWLPYGNFGWPSDFVQLVYLSPNNYLWGFLGALLRVKDALLLFKLSILADQCLSAIGVWLLSSLLFRRRDTRLLTGLAAAGCVVWYAQVSHNFRAYYLFPLAAYFLFNFFRKARFSYLALAGLTMTAQLMGGGAYYLCLWFFVFTLMVGVMSFNQGSAWRRAFSAAGRKDIAWTVLWGLMACFLAYFVRHSMAPPSMATEGRDPATGKVLLDNFLTYGRSARLKTVIADFISGRPTHLPYGSGRDNSVYVGLLTVVFFAWGVLRVRSREFLALLTGLGALVWLSLGGTFARMVYHFPLMAYYRHIGLVYGAVKILLIFCAGFGWEDFWAGRHVRWGPWVCLGVLAVDLLAFQDRVFQESYRLAQASDVFDVHPLAFQDMRLERASDPRQIDALKVSLYPGLATYAVAYDFAQFDPCRSAFRTDQMSPWARTVSGDGVITACGSPKIRFVPRAAFASSDSQAAERIRLSDPKETTVLSGEAGPAGGSTRVTASQQILAFAPDRLTLKADVRSSPGAWLVYSDAYHPGWSARVNGAARPIHRSDLAFKAVWLDPGASLVELAYRPAIGVRLSSVLALLGIAVACAVPLCLLI